ncbi:hypothetical protein V3C99_002996 [Haemonchus contortus]|nr:unnamed protein product [Haemonchus contortus]
MEDEGQPNFHRMESEATRTSEALSTFAPSTKVSPTQMETKSEQTDSNLSTVVMSVAVDSSTQSDSEQESKEGDRLLWREIYAETVPERSLLGFGRAKYSSEAKLILNRVSGYADPGQVTFIMGASGAGKSTLLNILTQKKTEGIKFSGDVAINGSLVEWGDMKKLSAYVQQEDLFIGQATVEEQLMFTARLRMRDKRTNEERKAIVSEALTAMGLTECRKTQIGNALVKSLSKGERKRLAFATEILSNPRILFCDEPTSGLDSFMSLQIVVALKMFASQGKTVVTTIHQPSSQVYEMADRLILMANGEVAFQGNASEVGEFLNDCGYPCPRFMSLPDHMMKVLSQDDDVSEREFIERVEGILEFFGNSDDARIVHHITHGFANTSYKRKIKFDLGEDAEYCASWCTQTWWLFVRSSRSLVRNPVVVVVRLVQVFAISMILGLIYFQSSFTKDSLMNYKGAALRATADMTYIFLFPCVYLFIAELPVVIREYQSHTYAPSAYFIGTSMASVLQYIIFPTMYSFILYLLAGYSGTVSQFCLFNLLNIVVANLAASVAYAAACIFGNQEMAVTFLPLILKPLFVFAGFLIDLRTVPIYFKPLTYISWYKYAYEAHLIILLNPIDTIPGCPSSKESDAMICSAKNGDEVLNLLGFDSNYFWINFAILLFILCFLRGLALVVFSLRIRHS